MGARGAIWAHIQILFEGDRSPKSPFLGATSAKSQKNGEQDYSPFGQSLVEIEFRSQFANFRIASATHHHNNQTAPTKQQQQRKPQQ